MYVYIVYLHFEYEGDDIIEVHLNEEKAQKAVDEYNKKPDFGKHYDYQTHEVIQ